MNDKPKYVTDIVGEEYKEWQSGNIIQISAPTGTGKSHFVFYKLLRWVIDERENNRQLDYGAKKILYLVNRKILKKQMESELNVQVSMELYSDYNKKIDLKDYIEVETYQCIETKIKKGDLVNLITQTSHIKNGIRTLKNQYFSL